MDISPRALRRETLDILKQINEDLDRNPTPEQRAMLLMAKAQCFNTLAILRGQ